MSYKSILILLVLLVIGPELSAQESRSYASDIEVGFYVVTIEKSNLYFPGHVYITVKSSAGVEYFPVLRLYPYQTLDFDSYWKFKTWWAGAGNIIVVEQTSAQTGSVTNNPYGEGIFLENGEYVGGESEPKVLLNFSTKGKVHFEHPVQVNAPQYRRQLELRDRRMNGDDVLLVQSLLNEIAMDWHLEEDGWFGPKTKAAVEKFQRDFGIMVTGAVDKRTWDKMIDRITE